MTAQEAPKMSLIVAMTHNRCIGNNNELMWHLREDMLHFKQVTSGKPVIMGRKTYDSIGRPLPARHNIVISRQTDLVIDGCEICHSSESACSSAEKWCLDHSVDEYFVIGGAEIYNQLLDRADRLYLTLIDARLQGDAWFPDYDKTKWLENSCRRVQKDGQNDWDFSILELHKRV